MGLLSFEQGVHVLLEGVFTIDSDRSQLCEYIQGEIELVNYLEATWSLDLGEHGSDELVWSHLSPLISDLSLYRLCRPWLGVAEMASTKRH